MPYIPYIPWPAGLGSPLVALQEELVLRPSGRGLWPLGEGGPCGADLWLPRGLQEPWRFSMVGWFWWLDGWIFRSWWEESSRDVMDVMGRSCIMAIYEWIEFLRWFVAEIGPTHEWNPSGTGPKKRPQKTAPKNGPRNWFHGWSGAKKEWCCAHKSRGCPRRFPWPLAASHQGSRGATRCGHGGAVRAVGLQAATFGHVFVVNPPIWGQSWLRHWPIHRSLI